MMGMKIYIAGKITGLDLTDAFAMFAKAEDVIDSLGHYGINPMKLVDQSEGRSYYEMLKEAVQHLSACDAIFLLPNWNESSGARLEYFIASSLGFTVYTHDQLPEAAA